MFRGAVFFQDTVYLLVELFVTNISTSLSFVGTDPWDISWCRSATVTRCCTADDAFGLIDPDLSQILRSTNETMHPSRSTPLHHLLLLSLPQDRQQRQPHILLFPPLPLQLVHPLTILPVTPILVLGPLLSPVWCTRCTTNWLRCDSALRQLIHSFAPWLF